MKIKDRIVDFKRVKASKLIPHPRNWRTHPDKQKNALKGVLAEIGYADAIVVREHENGFQILDGHLRAETTPEAHVPVLVTDLNDEEAEKFLVTHDPLGALATTDNDNLKQLLDGVETESEALADMLSGLPDLDISNIDVVPETKDTPLLPDDPVTNPGDIWAIGDHRLMCGDCRSSADVSKIMGGDSINIAITSPPYAAQRKYDGSSEFKPIPPEDYIDWFKLVQENIANNLSDDGSWFVNIKEHCDDGQRVLYVKDLTLTHVREWGWMLVDELVWTHGGTPRGITNRFKNGWEPVFHFTKHGHKFRPDNVRKKSSNVPDWGGGHPSDERLQGRDFHKTHPNKNKQHGRNAGNQGLGGSVLRDAQDKVASLDFAYPSNVLSLGKNREATGHPAAYPVSLPEFFIKAYSDKGDIIYDPFMGSGSTIIAAEQVGRKCYGLEISPAYCDVAVIRWENYTGEKAKLVKSADKK